MEAMRLALVMAMLAAVTGGAAAWGRDGHRLTCIIAQPFLNPEAKAAIHKLLPSQNFPDLCPWADDVRRSYRFQWSGPLHYIDTPDHLCGYNYDRDCHNSHGQKDMCVAGAINNYTAQLETFQHSSPENLLSSYNLTESLLFVAHYVGDIHQPLHVGFTSDAGGNGVHVHWYGRRYNLHHIWDTEFITKAKQLYYHDIFKMSHNISNSISNKDVSGWTACEKDGEQSTCTDSYATESIQDACKWAYKDASDNSNLGDDYFHSRLPIVQQRLAQGGVRLAAILNKVFSKHSAAK